MTKEALLPDLNNAERWKDILYSGLVSALKHPEHDYETLVRNSRAASKAILTGEHCVVIHDGTLTQDMSKAILGNPDAKEVDVRYCGYPEVNRIDRDLTHYVSANVVIQSDPSWICQNVVIVL